jgi:RNA-directed DNA polymerase
VNTWQLCWELGDLPKGRFDKAPEEFIAKRLAESPTGTIRLMESICERENMQKAMLRVEKNAGAPGVDGTRTSQLRGYMRRHWEKIKASLLDGTYKPFSVLRKEIKKPDGVGVRLLGIPTVLDRCIQQAMAQVLQEIWEHTFSEYSYGFRPGRSQHMAIQQAKCYVEEGYTHVVDIDLAKFFDRVNHDRLMSRLAQRINDKRVLKVIRAFLNSGIMIGDIIEEPGEGTPQGGPLSPLLANIVLDELDKELEKRGLYFVRYADDCAIYVKSKRAGERVMQSVSRFITRRLKLAVNEAKSSVTRPWISRCLGFRITRMFGATLIGIHQKSIKRFKEKIRTLTARERGRSIGQIISEINGYVRGWWAYFRIGGSKTIINEINDWILRRLRAYTWKQWKLPKTKVRELKSRGVTHYWAVMVGNTRKGAWRLSKHGQVIHALPDKYFTAKLGLVLLG